MNFILGVVGVVSLSAGVCFTVLAFSEDGALWQNAVGGALLGLSYLLVWIKK